MISIAIFIVCILLMCIISATLTYIVMKHGRNNLEKENEFRETIEKEIRKYKDSGELKAIIENNYLKGKNEGVQEELKKWVIVYDTMTKRYDGPFRKKVEVGYKMQLFYNNLPIGDPTTRVTKSETFFKEETVKYIIESVKDVVEDLVLGASKSGIKAEKRKLN